MPGDDPPPTRPVSRAIWHFSPQWFLIPQGTGILAITLHQLHYQFGALRILAKIVWIYTIAVLGLFLILYFLRAILHPKHVHRELRNNILETSYLASISICFTTIIDMVALQYGYPAGLAAYILWWISTALAIISLLGIPYIQLKLQPPGIEQIPPAILCPLISILTSAAGGATICTSSQISDRLRVPAIIVSYLEVGTGMPLAVAFVAIVLFEHFRRHYPTPNMVYQDMIITGPFGQGGFALMSLGKAVLSGSFASYDRGTFLTAAAAAPMGYVSQLAGLMSWGFATFWWCFALISILHTLSTQEGGLKRTTFTLSSWGMVFPWGVYTLAAIQLGSLMNSPAFQVWSTVLLLLMVVLTIFLTLLTLKGIVTGKILGVEHGWRHNYVEDEEKEA